MKLYNGNCEEVIKSLPDKSVDMIYTDIPYDIQGGGSGGCFGIQHRNYHTEYFEVSNNRNSISDFAFDWNLLDEMIRVMRTIYIYIWCSKKQIPKLLDYFVTQHKCFFEIICWCKSNPIPACNNTYLSDIEYCLFFREKNTKIYGEVATKHKWYLSPLNTKDKKIWSHPTIKPLPLVKNHIYNSLDPTSNNSNFVVLDPFMGSGTTGVACKELGIDFIGIELNEEYFKIAKERIENHNFKIPTNRQRIIQQSIFDILGDSHDE